MNWTISQVEAAERRIAENKTFVPAKVRQLGMTQVVAEQLGIKPQPRGMNKWEELFGD